MPVDVWAIDSLAFSGRELRLIEAASTMADGTALGSRSGVRPGDPGMTVALSGSTINVSPGVVTVGYPAQGVYRAAFGSTTSPGTLNAAHATLPRTDLVYVRVWDNSVDGGGLNTADIVYLPGTASATPTAPVPAGTQIYMPLATIAVPASGSGSPSVNSSVRPVTVAPGGILPDAAAPGLYAGQYRDNGSGLERYDGAAWITPQPRGIGAILFARKSADTSRANNITNTDDPHLSVSLAANATYTLEALIAYSTPNAADFKMAFTTPAGATQMWSPWGISDDSDTNSGGTVGRIRTGISTGTALSVGIQATTTVTMRPVGLIRTAGTAGPCAVQWSQSAASATPTILYTDSFLKLQRVA